MWVLAFHLRHVVVTLFDARDGALLRLAGSGLLGVDLFFVLSGFVMGWTWLDRFARPTFATFGRFALLRLARLWPLHLALLSILVAVVVVGPVLGAHVRPAEAFGGGDLAQQVLLVHAFGGGRPAWNVVSWSISAEWAAYLAFPLVAFVVARVRRRWIAVAIAGAAIATSEAVRASVYGGATDLAYRGALVRVAGPFVAGVALARLHALEASPTRPAAGLVAGGLAAAVAALLAVHGPTPVVVPLFAAIVLSLARSPGRLLGSRPLRWLGELSFALYLVQGVSVFALTKLANPDRFVGSSWSARSAVLVAHALGNLALAVALHQLVEEPAREALRRRLARRARAPGVVAEEGSA